MIQSTSKDPNAKEKITATKEVSLKNTGKQDPTTRWSERVRELPSRRHRPVNYLKRKDNFDDGTQSVKTELQQILATTQSCIIKRPLTSMVIAITAGAAITALLAAAMGSKKDTK